MVGNICHLRVRYSRCHICILRAIVTLLRCHLRSEGFITFFLILFGLVAVLFTVSPVRAECVVPERLELGELTKGEKILYTISNPSDRDVTLNRISVGIGLKLEEEIELPLAIKKESQLEVPILVSVAGFMGEMLSSIHVMCDVKFINRTDVTYEVPDNNVFSPQSIFDDVTYTIGERFETRIDLRGNDLTLVSGSPAINILDNSVVTIEKLPAEFRGRILITKDNRTIYQIPIYIKAHHPLNASKRRVYLKDGRERDAITLITKFKEPPIIEGIETYFDGSGKFFEATLQGNTIIVNRLKDVEASGKIVVIDNLPNTPDLIIPVISRRQSSGF